MRLSLPLIYDCGGKEEDLLPSDVAPFVNWKKPKKLGAFFDTLEYLSGWNPRLMKRMLWTRARTNFEVLTIGEFVQQMLHCKEMD